jgi:ADP-heptose:LPS heptosyltransferase
MMKHTYLTTVRWKRILQQCTDFFIDIYASLFIQNNHEKTVLPPEPKFLFVSLGHLGDALILSYVFPLVKKRYPNAIIDVITSSSCFPVLKNNSFIRKIHIFNHIRNNRAPVSRWKKISCHYSTLQQALKDIRQEHYDVSIEGRVHYPNGNIIALLGNIRNRIGFGSGGYGGLLSRETPLPEAGTYHLLQTILKELEYLGIHGSLEEIHPYFMLPMKCTDIDQPVVADHPYILLHPESGAKTRMLTSPFLQKILTVILTESQLNVVVCGVSPETSSMVDAFSRAIPNAALRITNMVGKLSLDAFFQYSRHAIASVTVESFAAHFCAIFCPTFSFFKNGSGALYFPLPGRYAMVVHNDVASRQFLHYPHLESNYVPVLESDETLQYFSKFIAGYLENKTEHS